MVIMQNSLDSDGLLPRKARPIYSSLEQSSSLHPWTSLGSNTEPFQNLALELWTWKTPEEVPAIAMPSQTQPGPTAHS